MSKIKKNFYIFAVIWTLCLFAFPAFAAPVAKVKTFPNGEGLEEFLNGVLPRNGVDASRITRLERGVFDEMAILVVPLRASDKVELYKTSFDEETLEVVPKRGERDDLLAEAKPGDGLLFWGLVPEVVPNLAVVVYVKEEGFWSEHFWFPAFSGMDGALITDDEFVPFEE